MWLVIFSCQSQLHLLGSIVTPLQNMMCKCYLPPKSISSSSNTYLLSPLLFSTQLLSVPDSFPMILIAMREEREEEDVTPMRFHHPDNLCKGEGEGGTLDSLCTVY